MMWSTPGAPTAAEPSADLVITPKRTNPVVVARRTSVEPVVKLEIRPTVSAGQETTPVPMRFDVPQQSTFRNVFKRLVGNQQKSLQLVPELQSTVNRDDEAMPIKKMNTPYRVTDPAPWYEAFMQTR